MFLFSETFKIIKAKSQDSQDILNFAIWVCLKIVYPCVPNGFADHYPVFKWLFDWEYTLFSDKPYLVSGYPLVNIYKKLMGKSPCY